MGEMLDVWVFLIRLRCCVALRVALRCALRCVVRRVALRVALRCVVLRVALCCAFQRLAFLRLSETDAEEIYENLYF